MREMVLNHASLCAPGANRECVTQWLKDMVDGMARLTQDRVVRRSLRMARGFHETACLPDYSLFDACRELKTRSYRDSYVFVIRLATKVPLLIDIGEDIGDRFRACEERNLAPPDGEPLVFCAITDGVAVGFPSLPEWDRDRVTVHFEELLPDESIELVSEDIDQLSRAEHADPICTRYRNQLLAGSDATSLWENRETAFPNLSFGPGVQDNLRKYSRWLSPIIQKLRSLDDSAREWRELGGSMPIWKTKVTPESRRVRDDPVLRESRRFASRGGTRELFEWHARFGNSGRIHLRFDSVARNIEIGYIGPHLPL